MRTFADAEARLAETLPGYESRPQQKRFARAVEATLEGQHDHLIAEAGCGTGKSLGYLIPAILTAHNPEHEGVRRIVVSTATKALQDQIAKVDLPFLAEHLGVDFEFAVLKGRSNYFCNNKAQAVADEQPEVAHLLRIVAERGEDEEFSGERDAFGGGIPWQVWQEVAANTDDCSSLGCSSQMPGERQCWAKIAKDRALTASVVVVNHALLMTDVALGHGLILGPYDLVVLDEAHEVEEYAASVLGARFTKRGLQQTVAEGTSLAVTMGDDGRVETIGQDVLSHVETLWSMLSEGRIRPATIAEHAEVWEGLSRALWGFDEAVRALRPEQGTDEVKRHRKVVGRTRNAAERFSSFITAPWDEVVRWVEVVKGRRGEQRSEIHSAPINVGPILAEGLWTEARGILVSATMSVQGRFDFISGRLGLDILKDQTVATLDVGTPFDFTEQARLFVPTTIPAPAGSNRNAWEQLSIQMIHELVSASEGRALLLFTSARQMRMAYESLSPRLPWTCLMQGNGWSNPDLAEEFMADESSVLFATRSFFTGVDFKGNACSLVVMDKLPFPVPTEPMTEARCEAIKARGGSDFGEYTIPTMSLVLQQGFGRLIRHRDDRGVVAILDPRLKTKGYGRQILRSLPPAREVDSVEEVRGFLSPVPA